MLVALGEGKKKEAARRPSFSEEERWVESVAIFALKVEEIYFEEQFSEEVFTHLRRPVVHDLSPPLYCNRTATGLVQASTQWTSSFDGNAENPINKPNNRTQ
jgi:hypothetical protein